MFLINFNQWKCACVGINNWVILLRAQYKRNHNQEIHDVTTIWKRNVCSFIVTLNAFDVLPTCDTADVQAILPFQPNDLKHVLCDVPDCGRTSNAFKVTMKLQTFVFQMEVTSYISVQYLWKYGFAKSSDNLYAPSISSACIAYSCGGGEIWWFGTAVRNGPVIM